MKIYLYSIVKYLIRLPRTSSLKLIDAWLIFTLIIPFMEVILHTKMVMIRKSMENLMVKIKTAWGNEKKQHTMEELKKSAKLLRFENNCLM